MYKNIYTILIDLGDMKLYSVLRMISYICTQSSFFPTTSVYQIYVCILFYIYICNKSITKGATCGAGTAYTSGVPEFTDF